ncbi:MAG TPA: hypothetical protein VGJ04_03705 [Pirellulales bacterium]
MLQASVVLLRARSNYLFLNCISRGGFAVPTMKNIWSRRYSGFTFGLGIAIFSLGSHAWALDYGKYRGPATLTHNGEPIEGTVIYVDSSEVRVSFPNKNSKTNKASTPSTFKSREIQEIRFADDKLSYDQNAHRYVSAADEQAKRNGRVRIVNKTKQQVQIIARSYLNHIGDEEGIDQDHDPKAASWQLTIDPQDSKYFNPDGKQLMTSMLKFDVVTGDGKTHQLRERDLTQTPGGGEFEIPIEDKDLHKPKIVELVKAWKFNQGDWSLNRLEGKYGSTHERATQSNSNLYGSKTEVGTGGYRYGYAPYGYGYGYGYGAAPGYAYQEKDERHTDNTTNEKEKNDGKSELNNYSHKNAEGLGNIIATLRNPKDKPVSVTATVTVMYHDITNPDGKLVTRLYTDTLKFNPKETKDWVITAPGTNSSTEGTVTDFDLSTEVASH